MTAPILQTARLTLRPLAASDRAAITDALSNWNVTRWLSQPPFPYRLSDAEAFIAMVKDDVTSPHWALDRGAGLIGVISVKPELGYWLAQPHHGQGLMTEAANAVVDWYFNDHTDPIVSSHFAGNSTSRTILTKLGFINTHTETIIPASSDAPVTLQRMILTRAAWGRANG